MNGLLRMNMLVIMTIHFYSFIKVINMVFSCKATEHSKEAAR